MRAATEARRLLPGEESARALIEAYQRLGRIQVFWEIRETPMKITSGLFYLRKAFGAKGLETRVEDAFWRELYVAGDFQQNDLETDKALNSFCAGLRVFGSSQDADSDHDSLLSDIHFRLCGALSQLGSEADALANLRKAIAISESLD